MKQSLLRGVSLVALGAVAGISAGLYAGVPALAGDSNVTAEVFVNSSTVTGNTAIDNGAVRVNELTGSYNNATGIAEVQQNNGSSNNIGAATAVHVNIAGNQNVNATAATAPTSYDNFTLATGSDRRNTLTDSFNAFAGIATAVHSSLSTVGDVVQTANAVATSVSQSGGQAADLVDTTNVRLNEIDPAFTNATGVFTVQQNNGNANAIGAATSVVANTGAGSLTQNVAAVGIVNDNFVDDLSASRDNRIVDSFNGAAGVATVQQNNGDANAMAAATAFAVNLASQTGDAASNDGQTATATQTPDGVAPVLITSTDVRTSDGTRDTVLQNSFVGFQGIATVQQNNGNNNIVDEAIAVKADLMTTGIDGDDEVVLQTTSSSGGLLPRVAIENAAAAGANDRDNKVVNGFNGGAAGILKVQQNNADNSYLGVSNTLEAAIDTDQDIDTVTASAAATDAAISETQAADTGANRANLIDPSFVGAKGLISVQQNNGNNSVLLGSNAIVANINTVENPAAGLANSATGHASITDNTASMADVSDRSNQVLNGSFDTAAGVITVQQNNADNSILAASNAVAADQGGSFGASLSTSSLSATVSGNTSIVAPSIETGLVNTVQLSFNQVAGVVVLQQNNGNNTAMQSALSMVANY